MHFFFTVPIPQQSVLFLLVPDMLMNAQTVNWAITTAQSSQFCELSSGDRNERHQLLENELGARKREKHTNQSSSGYIWMRAEVFLKTTQVVFNNVSRSMQCIWQIGINKTTVFTWF